MTRPEPAQVIGHFHLGGALTETPTEDLFGLMAGQATSLKDLLQRLDKARHNRKIKAVALTFDKMTMGLGQLEELHSAIGKLKDHKKPVLVHAQGMSTPVYSPLSNASKRSASPGSTLALTGLYGE